MKCDLDGESTFDDRRLLREAFLSAGFAELSFPVTAVPAPTSAALGSLLVALVGARGTRAA